MDNVLRASVAKGVLHLSYYNTESDPPHRVSDDVILDLCFPADAASGGQSL